MRNFLILRPAFLLLVLVAFSPRLVFSREADSDLTYFRELVETRNYSLGQPVTPRLTPDGKAVVFLRGGARDPVLRLYEFAIAERKLRELLTPEKLLAGAEENLSAEERSRRERSRQSLQGFTSFDLTRDANKILVSLSGKLYLVLRATGAVTELPGSTWIDPHFSPDGQSVAAVRAGELHVINLTNLSDVPVTSGANEKVEHGVAEFVAQEEMDRHEGFWWSPDSSQLAFQETDNSEVEARYIADPLHPEKKPAKNFYPRAGSPNAKVRLGIVSARGGEVRWINWEREKFPYLTRVVWKEAKAPLTILVQDRAQQHQLLLAADPSTGATRELWREQDEKWLNLDPVVMPVWWKDGSAFLWTTETRGAWQLELHAADGKLLREITPRDFNLHAFIDLDEASRSVVVSGGSDARELQLFRFEIDRASPPKRLTSAHGRHNAIFGEEKSSYLHSYNLLDGQAGWEVARSEDGGAICPLPSVAEHPSSLPNLELLRTETPAPMDAALVRPHGFKAQRRYPVLLDVYAGPHGKQVIAQPDRYMIDQWMADRGYIVALMDGRGTPGHGRAWERAIRDNLIDPALEDQIAGLQALAKHEPAMDLSRVGVVGWSFGGYFSAMATMRRPDIFRCGIAGAPVVTWENYDTYYTERYLGLPNENAQAYRVSDVLSYTDKLERPLFLIHGLTDDNVYFQHSVQLAEALYSAGKPFEFLPLLGTHMVSDPLLRLRRQMRMIEFFDRELHPQK